MFFQVAANPMLVSMSYFAGSGVVTKISREIRKRPLKFGVLSMCIQF